MKSAAGLQFNIEQARTKMFGYFDPYDIRHDLLAMMVMHDRDPWGYSDDVGRHTWRSKSDAAMRREQQAKDAFTSLKAQAHQDGVAHKTTFDLLPPSVHLTQPCWKTFRQFVTGHAGWSVSRTAATAVEKAEHKETRQATVYFTTVTYDPKKGGAIAGTGAPAAKAATAVAASKTALGTATPANVAAAAIKKAKIPPGAAAAMQENLQPPVKKQKKVKNPDADDSPDWHP